MSVNPPIPLLFNEMCDVQESTNELIGWSCLSRRLVVMDYPTYANGQRVPPPRFARWLEDRNLIMAYFCAVTSPDNEAQPARIDVRRNQLFAVCHVEESGSGYRLNITSAYGHATLVSAYGHLPTKSHGKPDMARMLGHFLMLPENGRLRIGIAERFAGFIGDHKSQFENVQNQNLGASRRVLGKRTREPEPFPMPMPLQGSSSASTSVLKHPRRDRSLPSISNVEVREAELCTRCMCFFPYDVLRRHILEEHCEEVVKKIALRGGSKQQRV